MPPPSRATISLLGLTEVLASLTVFFGVTSQFSGLPWYLEIFSNFRWQLMLSALFCSVIFAIWRKKYWLLVMLLVGLWQLSWIIPWYWPANSQTTEKPAFPVTLLQSNVQASNQNYAGLAEWLLRQQADLLVLQEVTAALATYLQPKLHQVYPYQILETREDSFGIALYSRYPLAEAQVLSWPPLDLPNLYAKVQSPAGNFSLLASHPIPPLNQHYHAARNAQLKQAVAFLQKETLPSLLIGDLNLSHWSLDYEKLLGQSVTGLTNTRQGYGFVPTWPTYLSIAAIALDHCLVSQHWQILDMQSGSNVASDHWPIVVKLALPITASAR